ncbi:MAG: hypothetical protein HY927_07835 [Elusimicrobia bacterium]|nr:hypothetical protein [Elusimicrobiota bacterium]
MSAFLSLCGALVSLEPWVVRSLLACSAVGAYRSRRELGRLLERVGPRWWLGVALVTAGAGALRFAVTPHRHQVLLDEYAHMAIAETLSATGRLCQVSAGTAAAPEACSPSSWPGAHHTLLALAFDLFGAREGVAFGWSAFLGTLTVPLMFLAAFASWEDRSAALMASALLAAWGVHLRYSAATETCVTSCFLVLAAFLAFSLHVRERARGGWWLLLGGVGAAALARFENGLLLVFVPLLLRFGRRERLPWAFALATLACLGVCVAHMVTALRLYPLELYSLASGAALVRQVGASLWANLAFWFDARWSSPYAAAFFAVGAYRMLRAGRDRYPLAWIAVVFLACGIYRNFTDHLDHDRYSLALLPLYLGVCGWGFAFLTGRWRNPVSRWGLGAVLAAAVLAHQARFVPRMQAAAELLPASRGRAFLDRACAGAPGRAGVMTFSSAYVAAVSGRSVVWPSLSGLPDGPLLLFKDASWHLSKPQSEAIESGLRERYRFERLGIMTASEPEGPLNYSLYLLRPASRR